MRTTVDIDDALLLAAKAMARSRRQTLGAVLSDLVRKGLASTRPTLERDGFPVFQVSEGAKPITLEDVKLDQDLP